MAMRINCTGVETACAPTGCGQNNINTRHGRNIYFYFRKRSTTTVRALLQYNTVSGRNFEISKFRSSKNTRKCYSWAILPGP